MAFDSNNYVAPEGVGYVAVVNGQKYPAGTQAQAEQMYNTLTAQGGVPVVGTGGNTPWTGSAAGQIPQATPGAPGYVGGASLTDSSGNSYYNPSLLSAAQQAANQAYLNARIQLERDQFNFTSQLQREQFAQQKAVEAFNQTIQQANLTGYVQPTPTDYVKRADAMWKGMSAEQRADGGVTAWQNLVPGLTRDEAAALAGQVKSVWAQTNAAPTEQQVLGFIKQDTGGRIDQTNPQSNIPTLAREQYETGAAMQYLNLLNQQRGPANAFAYLRTLKNTPASITDLVNRAVARMGVPGVAAAAGAGELGPGRMVNENTGVPVDAGGSALPAGSKIVAHDWNQASPYLRTLTLAGYEADNQDPNQVLDDYTRSLPKYGYSGGPARYAQAAYG